MKIEIDWSGFDKFDEGTVDCRCGVNFRSHYKFVVRGDFRGHISRVPCPGCGSDRNARATHSEPEIMVLK